MLVNKKLKLSYIFTFLILSTSLSATEIQPIMGAGPSTAVVNLFFKHFSELPVNEGYSFLVEQRSIKHAGGIRASEKYLFGRTGRPLNSKEKQQNKQDLFLARIPLGFVTGRKVSLDKISLIDLQKIFEGKITNWKEIGGPDNNIILIGREPTEAAYSVLKKDHPFFQEVKFDRIFKRDHQVVNYIQSPPGGYAIAFGAKSNFDTEYHLKVNGFHSGINLGLVYDLKNAHHPVIKAAIEYAKSDDWLKILDTTDYFLPESEVITVSD